MSDGNRDNNAAGGLPAEDSGAASGIPDFRNFPMGATHGRETEVRSIDQLGGTPAYTSIPAVRTTGVPRDVRLPPGFSYATGYALNRAPRQPQQLGGGGVLSVREGVRPQRYIGAPPSTVGPGGPYNQPERLIAPMQAPGTQSTSTGGPTLYPSSGSGGGVAVGSAGSVGRPGHIYHGHAAPSVPSGPPRTYFPPQYQDQTNPIRSHFAPPTPAEGQRWEQIINSLAEPVQASVQGPPTYQRGQFVTAPTGAVNPHDPRAARLLGHPDLQYREFRQEGGMGGGFGDRFGYGFDDGIGGGLGREGAMQYDFSTNRMGRTAGRCCGTRTRGVCGVFCAPFRLCRTCCCGDRDDAPCRRTGGFPGYEGGPIRR